METEEKREQEEAAAVVPSKPLIRCGWSVSREGDSLVIKTRGIKDEKRFRVMDGKSEDEIKRLILLKGYDTSNLKITV